MTLEELEFRLWRLAPRAKPGEIDLVLRAIRSFAEAEVCKFSGNERKLKADPVLLPGVTDKTYQGPPCKRGHTGVRYTKSHTCVDCERARVAARRAACDS